MSGGDVTAALRVWRDAERGLEGLREAQAPETEIAVALARLEQARLEYHRAAALAQQRFHELTD